MLRQIVGFVVNGIGLCINTTKSLILDRVGNLNITFYNFLIFIIFTTIVIRLISFIKGIEEMQTEKEANFNRQQKDAYNEWLRTHPSTPRRFKK